MSAPSVYAAIHAIAADLARIGIPKARTNTADDYKYRSIDDVLGTLAPLLAKHRLCVLPQVLERIEKDREIEGEGLCAHVSLRVGFTLTSVDDGTSHTVEAYGEALDSSDKATAKAMSAAYKSAMVQTFCIPAAGAEDEEHGGDGSRYRSREPEPVRGRQRLPKDVDHGAKTLGNRTHEPEPIQGWQRWSDDIIDIIAAGESEGALALAQNRYRALLAGLNRERPELYAKVGRVFARRRDELRQRTATAQDRTADQNRRPSSRKAKFSEQAIEHA